MNAPRRLFAFALFLALLAAPGCAWRQKSSSRIVAGEGSNIIYTNPESAGGRVGGD